MTKKETRDKVLSYAKKLPDIDINILEKGLVLFSLHREIEMLTETYIFKKYGLSARQVETLEVLYHKQDTNLTPADLAEEIHLTRSAMTSNLDSLQKKGLLSRTPYPGDRRKLSIRLTEKGLKQCENILPTRYREFSNIVGLFTPEMSDTIYKAYNILIDNFNKMIMEADN